MSLLSDRTCDRRSALRGRRRENVVARLRSAPVDLGARAAVFAGCGLAFAFLAHALQAVAQASAAARISRRSG